MLRLQTFSVGRLETNCYILYSDNKAAIIDPGDDFSVINGFLTQKQLKLENIILTHAHFDHIGALEQLLSCYNATVIINKADEQLLYDSGLNLSMSFSGENVFCKPQKLCFVNDGEMLEILDMPFTFIHTPGHSPGSMCISVDEYLFTGDTLFYNSIGNAFPPYGDTALEISSIVNKLYSLEKNYICLPGHGAKTYLAYEKDHNPYTSGAYSDGY